LVELWNSTKNQWITAMQSDNGNSANVEDKVAYLYRVSNAGYTGWRPAVSEIKVFSDQSCATEIEATHVADSGHLPGYGDGSAALDATSYTRWRPQCPQCNPKDAWITFSASTRAKCVEAGNLGEGAGGDKTWNGGILVDLWNSTKNQWVTAMQSDNGNSATKIEVSEFPTAAQVPDDYDEITGVWESDTDPRYTLSLSRVDEKTCHISAKVINSISGSVKHDGEKWQFHGVVWFTEVGIMDPELQNLERTVSTMLRTINGIERDGASLVVTFGDTTNRFMRAAKPSAVTKEDINWMN